MSANGEGLIAEAEDLISRMEKGIQSGTFNNPPPDAHVSIIEFSNWVSAADAYLTEIFGEDSQALEGWADLKKKCREEHSRRIQNRPSDATDTYYIRAYLDEMRAYRGFLRTRAQHPATKPTLPQETRLAKAKKFFEDNRIIVFLVIISLGFAGLAAFLEDIQTILRLGRPSDP